MNKKIVFIASVVLFTVSIFISKKIVLANGDVSRNDIKVMTQALAKQSFGCPNGCWSSRGLCYCYGYKPYEEAYWGNVIAEY
ncbi:hypothetical protein [Marinifilum caeruleilacunae]|uniref:NVEALA family protein n=1 Tax=Marinifilum caeruleilacunae TaxID=2499076 RepID=A0ABX1X1D6_9BACT|nr:hypothetical protein [Marinifilum caeruleilacunae]NOU62031.1 hypothetical protein [Marinifilum caeruleilacunae]